MEHEKIFAETAEENPELLQYAVEIFRDKNKKLKENLCQMTRLAEQNEQTLAYLSEAGARGGLTPDPYTISLLDDVDGRMDHIKTGLFRTYWAFAEKQFPYSSCIGADELAQKMWEERFKVFDVEAAVKGQLLLVKLPLLWGRYTGILSAGGHTYAHDSLRFMRWELEDALWKIRDEIPLYLHKNICYLHVVPNGLQNYTDNDNYDTKHITDTIAGSLLGSDSALICSFSLYSMREGELSPGSYAVVSPTFGAPPALDAIVPILKSAFPPKSS